MIFSITIFVGGMKRAMTRFKAPTYFEKHPNGPEDALFIHGTGTKHIIYFRNGQFLEVEATGQSDLCAARFDDFKPDLSLEDMPEWYKRLKDRIVSVQGEECYGRAQGIFATERISCGCAVGAVRNKAVELGPNKTQELMFVARISAKGPDSLPDALKLHKRILTGE